MNKLTHTEELFIAAYIKNGGNGTQAYLEVRPKASWQTAKANASRMLKKPAVISELQKVKSEKQDEAIASKEYLIKEAHEIGKDAYKKEKHGAALKAVEVKGKLNKVYDEEPEMQGYIRLHQELNLININPSKEDKEIIDVDPEVTEK
jgi:phage terminase small subunit